MAVSCVPCAGVIHSQSFSFEQKISINALKLAKVEAWMPTMGSDVFSHSVSHWEDESSCWSVLRK